MPIYLSDEDLFLHIRDLASQLQSQGYPSAAHSLQEGLASLNGLTDGWALLLESISNAIQLCGSSLKPEVLSQLSAIQAVVHKVVFR